MRRSSTLITLELDSSTLGEFRAAMAELADLPDSTFVTFTRGRNRQAEPRNAEGRAVNPVLLHLLFIVAGALIAFAALWYFARITGGWSSLGGLFTLAFLVLAVFLVLVGFGLVPFPGMETLR